MLETVGYRDCREILLAATGGIELSRAKRRVHCFADKATKVEVKLYIDTIDSVNEATMVRCCLTVWRLPDWCSGF